MPFARFKVKWALVKNSPFAILGPPLVLLALTVGLGVWGVLAIAREQSNTAKALAHNVAALTGESLQLFMARLIVPGSTLAALMEMAGSWEAFKPFFQKVAGVLVSQVPPDSITAIDVSPNGIWIDRYPRKDIPPEVAAGGIDELANEPYRSPMLRLIAGHVVGLGVLMDPNEVGGPALVAFSHTPMYKSNVSANETFGMPPGMNLTICPACYDPTTRTKYMGAFGVGFNLSVLSNLQIPSLQRLEQDGYSLLLTTSDGKLVLAQTAQAPEDPVTTSIQVAGHTTWMLHIEPAAGWSPAWVAPAIAAVVFFSVMACLLLLAVLLSRREHQMLLMSLVPKSVIERVKFTDDFVSSAKASSSAIETGTPAATILEVAADLLDGKMPALQHVILMRTAILQSYNLYEPLDLKQQLTSALDHDVARALMQWLGRGSATKLEVDMSAHVSSSSRHGSVHPEKTTVTLSTTLARLMTDHSMRGSSLTESCAVVPRLSGVLDAGPNHPLGMGPPCTPAQPWASSPQLSMEGMPDVSPPPPLVEEVESFLAASARSWDFNAFHLDSLTQGHGLSTLAYFLAHSTGLIQDLKLEPEYFARFLHKIEAGYRRNPYHNSIHASDVLHNFHVIMCRAGMFPGYVDRVTRLACYLAAAIHDFEHVGLTNDYLVLSSDRLAILYNDKAPMENHHIAAAFSILKSPGCDFLQRFSTAEMASLRKTIIDLVLATDMKQHFSILSQFCNIHRLQDREKRRDESIDDLRSSRKERDGEHLHLHLRSSRKERESGGLRLEHQRSGAHANALALARCESSPALSPVDESDRLLSLQVALKCADLCSLTKPLDIHNRWVCLLEQEFFMQGDKEKLMGLPVSPLFDRDKPGVTKSQTGFFSFVAAPLFHSFTRVFTGAEALHRSMLQNQEYWAEREQVAKDITRAQSMDVN